MMSLRPLRQRVVVLRLVAFALATACSTGTPAVTPTATQQIAPTALYDASRDLGPLFHDVQIARVFPDSKTFVDSKPLFVPADIAARYAAAKSAPDFNLRTFVERHFEAPRSAGEGVRTDTSQSMEEHIRALWPALTRP